MPGAAGVLRRALVIWGWGHIKLGDRRGWLLLLLQPIAICGLLFVAWQLIDGTRWLAVFVPLMVVLVIWVGQAVHAHQRAVTLGGAPGGELQLGWFLPVAMVVVTAFWLVGGRHGSPAATVEAYMDAWEQNEPAAALGLFEALHPVGELTDNWQSYLDIITIDIETGRASYGAASGLDPTRPFNSLRVSQLEMPPGYARFVVEVVRAERFETTLLGVIPTAGQRTVVVEQVLWIDLLEVDESDRAAPLTLPSTGWRIKGVALSPA